MSENNDLQYPFSLNAEAIRELLPHRGCIVAYDSLTIEGPHTFVGKARWDRQNPIIEGHFPTLPIVPGVMLIEALAQLAGAGLLAGDPYVRSLPKDQLGMLAGTRNCWFKAPVRPEEEVVFHIQCRQFAERITLAAATVKVGDVEVAKLEISIAYAETPALA
ncbi:3-hydroxyacyl-ACP dehydratase [Leeia sp. TBRC 13508]|uniref:3-hydroxyacyl-ACP dehydratase n=1 Tax=Leeia speluncae TaxID=2884804 RepID=A0ABS8D405_9NEIS|nr:3-hydroxyacyl-ACP dehydratase [Leeia speluncae]MCB6182901.1 3-hydroxyacyl-ACP dehydratase [Leeia speluncae]